MAVNRPKAKTQGPEPLKLAYLVAGDGCMVSYNKEKEELLQRLSTDGWTFVTLPEDIQALSKEVTPLLQGFFAKDLQQKKVYHDNFQGTDQLDGPVYGYNQTENKNKEGLRLLSGGRLQKNWIPEDCATSLVPLVNGLDQILIALLETNSKFVFGVEYDDLAAKFDLPLIKGHKKGKQVPLSKENFAMFDVAYYPNQEPSIEDLNVAGHYDPGLLSLSVLSTCPGLQVRNAAGKWIDCPTSPELGVLWAGEYAKVINNAIVPGWHRVKHNADKTPRLSAWVELCTKAQDLSYSSVMLENIKFSSDRVFQLPGVDLGSYMELLEAGKAPSKSSKKRLNMLYVKEGESLGQALSRASRLYGMPMTKTIRYYCPLCDGVVGDLEEHFWEKHPTKQQVIPNGSEDAVKFQSLFQGKPGPFF